MKRLIIPLAVFATIFLSWFVGRGTPPHGMVPAPTPRPSWASIWNGKFQQATEAWLPQQLRSYKYQVYLKNDLYDWINLGQFHATRDIVQGKAGVLYEQGYLRWHYKQISPEEQKAIAQRAVASLVRLRQLLAQRSIEMLLLMAPDKVDCRPDTVPALWTLRYGTPPPSSQKAFSAFEGLLQQHKISYVNCLATLNSNQECQRGFTDPGTHWSMLGAGLCLARGLDLLASTNPETFPRLLPREAKIIDTEIHAERDIAQLLNLYPPYDKGRQKFWSLNYEPLSKTTGITLFGDSFTLQPTFVLIESGYTTEDKSWLFANAAPPRDAFLSALNHSQALILVFTAPKFMEDFIPGTIAPLIKYLEEERPQATLRPSPSHHRKMEWHSPPWGANASRSR